MELELRLRAGQRVRKVKHVEDWAEIRRLHRAEGLGHVMIRVGEGAAPASMA